MYKMRQSRSSTVARSMLAVAAAAALLVAGAVQAQPQRPPSKKLTLPTANSFQAAPKLPDLYNECSGVTPNNLSEVDLNKVPIVEIDQASPKLPRSSEIS